MFETINNFIMINKIEIMRMCWTIWIVMSFIRTYFGDSENRDILLFLNGLSVLIVALERLGLLRLIFIMIDSWKCDRQVKNIKNIIDNDFKKMKEAFLETLFFRMSYCKNKDILTNYVKEEGVSMIILDFIDYELLDTFEEVSFKLLDLVNNQEEFFVKYECIKYLDKNIREYMEFKLNLLC